MKSMKTILLTLAASVLLLTAKAQYTGPGSEIKTYTVKEIQDDAIKLDRKDTMVKVKGFVVEKVTDEDYVFQDSTGKIRVEIDTKYLPSFEFNHETEVILTAEVDYDMLDGTELEVEKPIERAGGMNP